MILHSSKKEKNPLIFPICSAVLAVSLVICVWFFKIYDSRPVDTLVIMIDHSDGFSPGQIEGVYARIISRVDSHDFVSRKLKIQILSYSPQTGIPTVPDEIILTRSTETDEQVWQGALNLKQILDCFFCGDKATVKRKGGGRGKRYYELFERIQPHMIFASTAQTPLLPFFDQIKVVLARAGGEKSILIFSDMVHYVAGGMTINNANIYLSQFFNIINANDFKNKTKGMFIGVDVTVFYMDVERPEFVAIRAKQKHKELWEQYFANTGAVLTRFERVLRRG